MFVEQRVACKTCASKGKLLPYAAVCTGCRGEKRVKEQIALNFDVQPGVVHIEWISAEGKGHTMPGSSPGDVILVCEVQADDRFIRKGDDLMTEQEVPLQVAICGGSFTFHHLGGRCVRIHVARGTVLAPGVFKCVPGEGMPKRNNPHLRGDPILRFSVEFPESLSEAVAAKLDAAFTGKHSGACSPPLADIPVVEDDGAYLADFDAKQLRRFESLQEHMESDKCRAPQTQHHFSSPPRFMLLVQDTRTSDFGCLL